MLLKKLLDYQSKPKVATMSKDIWHKPSETTDVDNNLIIDDWTNGTYELGYFDDEDMIFRNFRNDDIYYEESMMCWCDVNELINDYNRTRKALDVAVAALKEINDRYEAEEQRGREEDDGHDWWDFAMDTGEILTKALEQITALEQKYVK